MKLSDFLREANKTIGLGSNELEAIASSSAISELEVDDSLKEKLENKIHSLLTIESAKNNPELESHFSKLLYAKTKGELLGNVDTSLMGFAKEVLSDDELKRMEEADFTKEKVKILMEGTKKKLADKSSDEETKKLIDGYQKQMKIAQQEKEEAIKAIQEEKEKEVSGINQKLIKNQFYRFVNDKYKLAENYTSDEVVKNAILNNLYEKAAAKATLTLDEGGNIDLRQLENPEMKFYIGGKEGFLNDLVDPEIKNYLKVSEPPAKKPVQAEHYTPQANIDGISPALARRLQGREEN